MSQANEVGKPTGSPGGFVNSLGMKMILVEGKAFDAWTSSLSRHITMKRAGGQPDSAMALNRPRVPIRVELNDYYLAQFTVTNKMYREFVKATGHRKPEGKLVDFYWASSSGATWELPGFKADNLPATGISKDDVGAFCEWLSKKEGRTYRPATIYEFEYANRAGTDTLFWWGDRPDTRKMNYGVSQIGHPTPVGSYPPNPWGFYDMHGNVWELCTDSGFSIAVGGAFNSPQRLTGADVWGNFYDSPPLRLLSMGFRLGCDVSEGPKRPSDLAKPTVLPARPRGPVFPELEITVGDRIQLGPLPSNMSHFMVTSKGAWILRNKRSTDEGKTWEKCTELRQTFCKLRDGTIMGVNELVVSFNPMEGRSELTVYVSRDDWQTVESFKAPIYIPLAKQFYSVRGLIELEDGRLLMTMYGWMDGDRIREDWPVTAFEHSPPVWIKARVIVVESTDKGKSWQYLSTLSYNPHLGHEAQSESDFIRLPSGRLFAAMRTGIHGYRDPHGRENMDQPLLAAWSADHGKTWSDPQRIYVKAEKLITGIFPRVLVTEEGVLAVLRTRPDGSVIFSPDGEGSVWTDEVVIYPPHPLKPGVPYHAAMNDMALVGPNTILFVDVVNNSGFPPTGGWHAEGVPITIRKKK